MVCTTCEKPKVSSRKGLWSPEEDQKLRDYVLTYGHSCWSSVPAKAGLQRNGKSCRLRWINYLRPGLKHGLFSPQEEATVLKLHQALGNKWSRIAMHLPGRTDNEIKNYWNSHLKKKATKVDGSTSHATLRPFPEDLIKHISPSDASERMESSSRESSQTSPDHVMSRSNGTSSRAMQPRFPVIFADWLPLQGHAPWQQSTTACSDSGVNWRCGPDSEANISELLEVVVPRKHEMVHGLKDANIYVELKSHLEHGEQDLQGSFDDHIFSMDDAAGGGSFELDHNLFFDENHNLIY